MPVPYRCNATLDLDGEECVQPDVYSRVVWGQAAGSKTADVGPSAGRHDVWSRTRGEPTTGADAEVCVRGHLAVLYVYRQHTCISLPNLQMSDTFASQPGILYCLPHPPTMLTLPLLCAIPTTSTV